MLCILLLYCICIGIADTLRCTSCFGRPCLRSPRTSRTFVDHMMDTRTQHSGERSNQDGEEHHGERSSSHPIIMENRVVPECCCSAEKVRAAAVMCLRRLNC